MRATAAGASVAAPETARCLACAAVGADVWATAWDVEYRTSEECFTFHRCRHCGALFIDPVPRHRLNEIYPANYYSFTSRDGSLMSRVKRVLDARFFRGLLRRVPGERVSALDVGGGSGEELTTLRAVDRRVTRTVVVDPANGAAAFAQRRGHEYVRERIEDFTSDEPFDLVLMLNIIEHVESPLTVLERVRGLLSPDGIVVVKTPNHDSLDARLFRHASWGGYHCPRHWVLFTRDSFLGLAARAGFEVREFSYTQGAPFWAVSILGWLAARGYVSVTPQRPVPSHPLYPSLAALFAAFDFARRPWGKTSQMFVVLEAERSP